LIEKRHRLAKNQHINGFTGLKGLLILIFFLVNLAAYSVPVTLAIPDLNEAINVYSRWDSLLEYIKEKSSLDIRIKLVKSHNIIKEGFEKHTLSFAFVDPFWFVSLRKKKLCKPIARVVMGGDDSFRSLLIVNRDSIFRNISDLKGKTIALVNPTESSAGYFLPVALLNMAGIKRGDFKRLILSDSYMSVLKGVSFGKLDAGFVSSGFLSRKETFPYKESIRIIMKSDEIPQWVIVARFDMEQRVVDALERVFLKMNRDDQGKALLSSAGFDGFVEVREVDYRKIEEYSRYQEPDFVSSE